MKHLLALLAVALCGLFLTGCDPHPRRHHVRHKQKVVQMHHLKDGRYVYRADDGSFWFYMYLTQSNGSITSAPYVNLTDATALPRGGVWESKAIANEAEVQELAAEVAAAPSVDQSISINDDGNPLSESQIEAEGRDGMDISEIGESGSDTSSDTDAGSSTDAGGGGDTSSSDPGSPGSDPTL